VRESNSPKDAYETPEFARILTRIINLTYLQTGAQTALQSFGSSHDVLLQAHAETTKRIAKTKRVLMIFIYQYIIAFLKKYNITINLINHMITYTNILMYIKLFTLIYHIYILGDVAEHNGMDMSLVSNCSCELEEA